MGDTNDHIADPSAVLNYTTAASVKPSPPRRFGTSPAERVAPVSHSPAPSKSFSLSNFSKKKKQKPPKSPSEISSILGGMYAHSPAPATPSDPGPSKTPFIYRKVTRPLYEVVPLGQTSSATDAIARARTLSADSVFPSVAEQTLQSIASLHSEPLQRQQPEASTSSLDTAPSGRLVGRGGIGSRPRIVASKTIVIPKLQNIDAMSAADSPHVALRPSGRGGLASRPQQLAPPPPPRSPLSPPEIKESLSADVTPKPTPVFIRPGGRGGMGGHTHASSPPLTLKDILHRKKQKSDKKGKGRLRNITTFKHPISSSLAYEIANASSETLSTIHFTGESTSPPPSIFHERRRRIQSSSADDLSTCTTPPFSATASTFDGSLSLETEDDHLGINIYLEGAPSGMSPEDQQQRRINKLTRTLGDNPYDSTNGALTHIGPPTRDDSIPKIFVDKDSSQKDKTKKFRRASISVSSLFGRTGRTRDDGLDSQSMIDTISDDLHRLGLGDDDVSESWGTTDASRMSAYGTPESPIVFSLPSPLPNESQLKSTLSVPSQESEEPSSFLSPTLARSQSYTLATRRQSAHIRHNHSVSSTLSEQAFSENSSVTSSVDWLFPPSNDDRDIKLVVTRTGKTEKPLSWTGEWNSDLHDVITALRELR